MTLLDRWRAAVAALEEADTSEDLCGVWQEAAEAKRDGAAEDADGARAIVADGSAMVAAARWGRLGALRLLVEQCGGDVNAVDVEGSRWTPLHWAAARGDVEAVRYLLAAGAERLLQSSEGDTAVHLAKSKGHDEVVKVLLATDGLAAQTVVALRQSIAHLKRQLSASETSAQALAAENAGLKVEIAEMKEDNQRSEQMLRQHLLTLNSNLEGVTLQLKDTRRAEERLQNQVFDKQDVIDRQTRKLADLTTQLEAANAAKAALQRQVDELQQAMRAATGQT